MFPRCCDRPESSGSSSRRGGPIRPPIAYAKRFQRSITDECLPSIVLIGERCLRHAIAEFTAHYHLDRNHQGLGNRLIDGQAESEPVDRIECRERLAGLLRSYHGAA